jgi:hypothetical protein
MILNVFAFGMPVKRANSETPSGLSLFRSSSMIVKARPRMVMKEGSLGSDVFIVDSISYDEPILFSFRKKERELDKDN